LNILSFLKLKKMTNKGSYWAKHKEKIHGDTGRGEKKIPALLTPEIKAGFEDGKVLLIDKPLHWTSFDIVRKIRNAVKIKKVGHAGTLDPLATGLLIVCTGKFTKKINQYMAQEKEYTGAFTLGAKTPTYDLESEEYDCKDVSQLEPGLIHLATASFIGEIQQVPPIYSAIKKDGTAMYELARRGIDVEIPARTIYIKSFEITSIALPIVYFKVVCSTGTYIRSLANDFGMKLGCGAYLSALRRTRIGEHVAGDAMTIDEFIASLNG